MANPRRDLLTKLIAREIEKEQQQQQKTLNTHTTTVYARLISLPLGHMLQDFYLLHNFRKICIRIF